MKGLTLWGRACLQFGSKLISLFACCSWIVTVSIRNVFGFFIFFLLCLLYSALLLYLLVRLVRLSWLAAFGTSKFLVDLKWVKVCASNESGFPDLMVASSGEDSSCLEIVGKFKKVYQKHCELVGGSWVDWERVWEYRVCKQRVYKQRAKPISKLFSKYLMEQQ